MYALPLLAGLLLANAIVLQYNAWSAQRTAQRLEHEVKENRDILKKLK
jgi:hypothetical protein